MPILQNKRPTKLSNKCWKKTPEVQLVGHPPPFPVRPGRDPRSAGQGPEYCIVGQKPIRRTWTQLTPWALVPRQGPVRRPREGATCQCISVSRAENNWALRRKSWGSKPAAGSPDQLGSERAPSSHTKASIRHGICQTLYMFSRKRKMYSKVGRQNYVRERVKFKFHPCIISLVGWKPCNWMS